jgi:putative transposase
MHRAQAGGAADADGGTACEHRRFRCTTDSRHGMAIKQNLLERRFTVSTPNRGWVTDITYVWTLEVGCTWR